ncbi:GNAT family N-acetyltransferase [Vagococcus fessus]|uniref:GNAT family N-acetyltransferase n=1 Tax=Vagococcus fessus TaxID=120370 RepID=A0A430A5C0_9ENTE|nr:GNAT family N-acetyltransferase [Vagococcus fessus]RSU01989.1 GNAT family N-acetyltransferase [Vagococcus fessus]
MTDMLVNLREVKLDMVLEEELLKSNIKVIRAIAPDKKRIVEWVERNSSQYASSECEVSFSNHPISCFIAIKDNDLIGYACYNATALNFFGPTRVLDEVQGLGVGKLLLQKSLLALHHEGYEYGIIGGIGPQKFYEKVVNARVIENSSQSIYDDFLKN